jgi:hypothetical protein
LLDGFKITGNPFRLEVAIRFETQGYDEGVDWKAIQKIVNNRAMDNIKYLVSNLAPVPVEQNVVMPLRCLCDALLHRLRIGKDFLLKAIDATSQQVHYQLCSEFMAIYTDCLAKFKVFIP